GAGLRDLPRDQRGPRRRGRGSAPRRLHEPVRGRPPAEPAAVLRVPPILRRRPSELSMKSRVTAAYSLHRPSGGGYSEGQSDRALGFKRARKRALGATTPVEPAAAGGAVVTGGD